MVANFLYSAGIATLIILVCILLYWQKLMWDASDAARYYRKPLPDYIRLEILSSEYPFTPFVQQLIDDFVYTLIEAMGYEGGGVSDDEKMSYHFEGMSSAKAEYVEKLINMYLRAIGCAAVSVAWEHYNNTEEEDAEL